MKKKSETVCIHGTTVASVMMFSLLLQSHKCCPYADSKIMTVDFVILDIYPFILCKSFFEKRPQKGARGGKSMRRILV